jgi:hypothetical protein
MSRRDFIMKIKIKELLRYLGCTGNYRGYHQVAYACELIDKDENLLLKVTLELYPKVGEKYSCKSINVERNIRTIIKHIWEKYPERLIEIARCDLDYPPTSTEFLDYLVTYVQRQEQREAVSDVVLKE